MNVDSRIPVGLLMVGIGLALVVWTGVGTYALQMTVAEPVEAAVLSSGVDEVACSTDEACDVEYVPVVEYRYTYDGTEFTSDSVFPQAAGHRSITEDGAAATASQYERGDRVTAHVLPMLPGTAYLRSNTPSIASLFFGGFGLLLFVAGLNGIQKSLRGIEPRYEVG